jgi:phenylacetate-CoA ligase
MKSQSYLWAGIFYSWLMAGYKFGEKVAFLSGSALVENKSLKKKLFYKFFNFIVFDINNNPISFKKDFISYAKKNNVSIVYGYAGVIFDVARELESFDDFLDCKSVVTTAEQLTPAMRALIEFRFNCKVFNQYGCNDAGLSAFECHLHNGFHYLSNRAYVKVVNGRLISTDNFNSSMPMIDYDTGDLAILSMEPCSCGLSFPLIKEIVGRQNDIVVSPAGHFHSSFFTQFFLDYKSIIRYQVIAKGGGHVLLKLDSLDVGENFRDVIANRLNSLMNVSVEIEFTSSFLSRSNGKVPVVVNVE